MEPGKDLLSSAPQAKPKPFRFRIRSLSTVPTRPLPHSPSTNSIFTIEAKAHGWKLLSSSSALFGPEWFRASAFQRSPHWRQPIRMRSLLHRPWGARGGAQAHLSIFTVLTKYIIHCHLLSGSTHRGAAAAKLIALLMLLS